MFRVFLSSAYFLKIIKNSNIFFKKAQFQNHYALRRYFSRYSCDASSFIRSSNSKGCTDASLPTFRTSNRCQKVGISRYVDCEFNNGFCDNDIESSQREDGKDRESVPRIIRKFEVTVRKLAKLTGRMSVVAVVPAPLQYHVIQRKQTQKLIQHNSFQRELKLSLKAKEELVL